MFGPRHDMQGHWRVYRQRGNVHQCDVVDHNMLCDLKSARRNVRRLPTHIAIRSVIVFTFK